MKKLSVTVLLVLLLIVFAAIFTACGSAKSDPNFNYRVTGAFADWGSNYEAKYIMEPVAKSDSRIAPLKSALSGAKYIYLYEYTPDRNNAAGWNVEYTGVGIRVDGIQAIKFIRLEPDSGEPSGWAPNAWMPSTEVGNFKASLSPETIYVPLDRSDEAADAAGDGLGSVNGNPVLLKGAVTYYVVLVIFNDNTRGIGAVVK